MGQFIQLISESDSPVMITILSIVLVYIFIKAIFEAVKWTFDRLNGYHDIRNNIEKKEDDVETRISRLERHDNGQFQKITELCKEVKEIISMIKNVQDTQSEIIIDTHRSAIYTVYCEAMKQGYITPSELERFQALVKRYKEAGGDGVVDEKIYPEVMLLQIKDHN